MSRAGIISVLFGAILSAFGGMAASQTQGSVIFADGVAVPNDYAGELPSYYHFWCNDKCIPGLSIDSFDVNGEKVGREHRWLKDFTSSSNANDMTFQFKEFILFDLHNGQIFTKSKDGGHPSGVPTDPELIPPKVGARVLLGGSEGNVVGGTEAYAGASGGFSNRLKAEDGGDLIIFYFDELFNRFHEVVVPSQVESSQTSSSSDV